jgi:hypothetical protein
MSTRARWVEEVEEAGECTNYYFCTLDVVVNEGSLFIVDHSL